MSNAETISEQIMLITSLGLTAQMSCRGYSTTHWSTAANHLYYTYRVEESATTSAASGESPTSKCKHEMVRGITFNLFSHRAELTVGSRACGIQRPGHIHQRDKLILRISLFEGHVSLREHFGRAYSLNHLYDRCRPLRPMLRRVWKRQLSRNPTFDPGALHPKLKLPLGPGAWRLWGVECGRCTFRLSWNIICIAALQTSHFIAPITTSTLSVSYSSSFALGYWVSSPTQLAHVSAIAAIMVQRPTLAIERLFR